MINMGSLFDGIGGFPLAGQRYGIKTLWASEVEAFPIAVTKIRFPDMAHVGDITKLKGAALPPVDIVCGGSPCQDVSQAGRRAGLAGERSGLFFEQIRVVKELRDADKRRGRTDESVRPRYMLWENVPGAFSSGTPHGEDFRVVLEEICGVTASGFSVPRPPGGRWESSGAIMGEKFSVAWRVVDAQYWFVPQRRKRIVLVADFAGHSASKILFEQDRLLGHFTPREEAWQDAPADAGAGSEDAGRTTIAYACNQRDEARDLHDISAAVCAHPSVKQQTFVTAIPINTQIATRHEKMGEGTGLGIGNDGDPSYTLQEAHSHAVFCADRGSLTPWDTQQARIFTADSIAPTVAGADGGGGRNPAGLLLESKECMTAWDVQSRRIHDADGVWPALYGGEGGGHGYVAAFSHKAGAKASGIGYEKERSPTLTSNTPSVLCINDQGGDRMDLSEDICGTLRSQMTGHPPIVMGSQQGGAEICEDLCPTITSASGTSGNNGPIVMASAQGKAEIYEDMCPTLSSGLGTQPVLCDPQGENAADMSTQISPRLFTFKNIHEYAECGFVSTQTARQHKSPTDLVCDVSALDCLDGSENQPAVYENHGIDSRYTGPHDVAPTVTSRFGSGGNNVSLVVDDPEPETYAIAGNIIGRKEKNGGNGMGFQRDISYTITSTDRHAIFSQQRSDEYAENDVTSTQAARQHKDATDLVCDVAGLDCRSGAENGDLCGTLQAHPGGGYSLNTLHPVRIMNLIRRLTPLECERLMHFPDGWTDIPGASDSKRYKALGNSVVVSCMEYVLRGIAYFLTQAKEGDI